jgi:pimeloyl-ACP methyl ester carboxylesterase
MTTRIGIHRRLAIVSIVASLAASCGGSAEQTASTRPTPPETSAKGSPKAEVDVIDGKFDVGGHSLYIRCEGSAPPTVVYMHGWIDNESIEPHGNGEQFIDALSGEHRVCVYDRRNLGKSDTVDAPQLPEDAITDMRNLLNAAGVDPPYVLLGASFGGLLSYLYANMHPDEIVGMVLLDSMFPDELSLEHLVPPKERQKAFVEEDEESSLERISQFKALKAAQRFIGEEPAIPVTYLASIPEGFDDTDFGPEFNEQILDLQEAYVDRFSPGRYIRVDSPHFMEKAIPDRITEELRKIIAQAGF